MPKIQYLACINPKDAVGHANIRPHVLRDTPEQAIKSWHDVWSGFYDASLLDPTYMQLKVIMFIDGKPAWEVGRGEEKD